MDARVARFWIWVGILLVGLAALFSYIGQGIKPPAERYADECMSRNPKLPWVPGETGVTVEKFCDGVADYKVLLDDVKAHPEFYPNR